MAFTGNPRFVGRVAELDAVREAVRRAASPGVAERTTVIEVVGEPGMGKTRLLGRFHQLAEAAGWAVVAAVADELGRDLPCDVAWQLLARLSGDPAAGGTVPGRYELYRLVRAALAAEARTARLGAGGVMVILDDLHWADAASLALLGRLFRDSGVGSVVFVLAYRPRADSRLLAPALVDAVGVERVSLRLGGLDVTEIGRLVGIEDPAVLESVFRRSGGNPLYALALAGSAGGGGDEPGAVVGDVPAEVSRALLNELSMLGAEQWTVATTASVTGDRIDPGLLAAVLAGEVGDCSALLEELLARDLLRADAREPGVLRFRHPVVRSVVYQCLSPLRRSVLHARVAAELGRRGAGVVARAVHVARSARPGDVDAVDAVDVLVRASGEVAVSAPASAAAWLRTALTLVPDDPGGAQSRVDIEMALADAEIGAGRLAEGRAILTQPAPAAMTAGQRLRRTIGQAVVERLLGRPDQALAIVTTAAAERAEQAERTEKAEADERSRMVALRLEGAVCATLCGSAVVAEHLAAARRLLGEGGDAALHAVLTIVESFAGIYFGPGGGIASRLAAAAAEIEALPDLHLVQQISPFGVLGWVELMLERDEQALRHFDRALVVAQRTGWSLITPFVAVGRSFVLARLGRLADAVDAATDAEDTASAFGVAGVIGLAETFHATALIWLTGPAEARPVAESAVGRMPVVGRNWFAEAARRALARVLSAGGQPAAGRELLVAAGGGDRLPWVEASTAPYWWTVLAEIALANQDVAAARGCTERAAELAAGLGLSGQTAHTLLARARLDLAAGEPARARELAAAAASTFAGLSWLPDEATARLLLAMACGAQGDVAAAERELGRVRRIADATGSRVLREAAVRGQRAAGARHERLIPLGQLTGRERDVVGLVSTGAANADIAARLGVTTKTVEAHLTRIFRKLGVTSRTALVATVRPGGPDPAIPMAR